jgi:hypothetical protein
MARVHQAVIRTRHRVQIALASQPKDLDRTLWLTFGVPASRTRFCNSFSNPLSAVAVSLQTPDANCRRLRPDHEAQIFLPPNIARMKCQRPGHNDSGEQEQRDRVSHPLPRRAASLSSSWIRLGHPQTPLTQRGPIGYPQLPAGHDCPKGQRHLVGAIR